MSKYLISNIITDWYQINKRALPWRTTRDPYLIWISEVVLQQTRIDQGLHYYNRFIQRFPDVISLSLASEQEVLNYWQGLGYYSRARNLHKASRIISSVYHGIFPSSYKDILKLPGIGLYTAAAICSFAYHQPYPVLDGNVFRVLSRLFGVDIPIDTNSGKKYFLELAGIVMNPKCPEIHNQAIMDFGSIQCVPNNPDCAACPLNEKCVAHHKGAVKSYPVKSIQVKVSNRYFNYFHVIYKDSTYLKKREEKDIWQNLFELPLIETTFPLTTEELIETEQFKLLFANSTPSSMKQTVKMYKHVLSHQILNVNFYEVEFEKEPDNMVDYICVHNDDLEQYPVSKLIHCYLDKCI